MDGVDFQYELGQCMDGNKIYGSKKDLERDNPCVKECGIVEVEVTLVRWVKKQDLFKDEKKKRKKKKR